MKKVNNVQNGINKRPLMALAIILFGTGIAYYTNVNNKEGFDQKQYPFMATIYNGLIDINAKIKTIDATIKNPKMTADVKDFLDKDTDFQMISKQFPMVESKLNNVINNIQKNFKADVTSASAPAK